MRTSTSNMMQVYPIYDFALGVCLGKDLFWYLQLVFTNLVDHSSSAEGLHVVGTGLNDGSNHVEKNGDYNQLDSTEDIGNLGRSRLLTISSVSPLELDFHRHVYLEQR